mmetsp:Transcript_30066/g.49264  ORF Transcript_30066/g.49264 Transcript_30066/m.49264 type:complete len:404 (+) Transcript_30066:258-1469(+)
MFRESLDANSKHYSLYVTGNQGIANQMRGLTGGTSSNLDNSGLNAKPVWIQVSKSSNEFSTAYKYEGATEWTPLWGPTNIGFSSDFYVGIVAHYHVNDRLATLKAREFNIIDMPTPEPQKCLMVTTGTPSEFSGGGVDVFVDSGSGYVMVSTPGKHHGEGEIVIDQCFHTIVGVQVSNQSVIGWAGVFELSSDGRVTYFPLTCSDCTGTTNTMPISVDGDDTFASDELTTWCFNGATCTLSVAAPKDSYSSQNYLTRNHWTVKVTLDGAKRILSLTEVQVFDELGQDVALASRGAEASQSSNYPGDFGAGNAIDGVTSTGIGFTHTSEELNPWWKVDLGAPHDIKKIVLWNRQDVGLSDRLSYATVSLLDSDKKSIAEMSIGDATGIEKFELDFNWTSVLTLK